MGQQANGGLAIGERECVRTRRKSLPDTVKPDPAIGVDQSLDHIGCGERVSDRGPQSARQRRTASLYADSVRGGGHTVSPAAS